MFIQQDPTLHNLFYLETVLHVSRCNTTHHQERKQHLVFVTTLLLPAAIAAGSKNFVGNNPKHVEQFPDKINCVTLDLVGYILDFFFCGAATQRGSWPPHS